MLAGLAASAFFGNEGQGRAAGAQSTYLELKTWRLHNSDENQPRRLADFLEHGLQPGIGRAGAQLAGVFSNVISPDGPYYVTLTQYASLAAVQSVLSKLAQDEAYQGALKKLCTGSGLPFVRVESSLLRSFDGMPQAAIPQRGEKGSPRIFELRTYESQSFTTLARKIGMFNGGEMQIFERLGMRPVFFGESIVGSRQPCLTYMLSYEDLAARDRLWAEFSNDPEWKKLRSQPGLQDAEIVANVSNVILRPLAFSAIR